MRMAAALVLLLAAGCGGGEEPAATPGSAVQKSAATVRAARRAFDGAPPTIPHGSMGVDCTSCHDAEGIAVSGLGFAPPMPHERTAGLSALSRCTQCHVYRATDELFVASTFEGLVQDLRRGERAHEAAPPRLPHALFLRENCTACHAGPAAREEIRCSHPERKNCLQCHVPVARAGEFERPGA